ncbi:MAG: hypothetical protein O7F71_08485 [Gammaproteobacteria bacterium]|nr:hypothetical protein [Gammaproteobacteria bacterium]
MVANEPDLRTQHFGFRQPTKQVAFLGYCFCNGRDRLHRILIETITRDLELIDGTFNAVPTFIPLTQIFMFACFIAAALTSIRKPDVHKRFMVLAALVATTPALARLFLAALGEPSLIAVGSIFLASNGLIVIVAWYDANCNNRLHPVFLYGGLGILLIRIARVPFAMSPIWHETAEFISTLTS